MSCHFQKKNIDIFVKQVMPVYHGAKSAAVAIMFRGTATPAKVSLRYLHIRLLLLRATMMELSTSCAVARHSFITKHLTRNVCRNPRNMYIRQAWSRSRSTAQWWIHNHRCVHRGEPRFGFARSPDGPHGQPQW